MKRFVIALVMLAGFLFSPLSFAGNQIGIVDMGKVVNASADFDQVKDELQKQFRQKDEDLGKQEQALKSDADKYKRDAEIMSKKERRSAEKKLARKQQELMSKRAQLQQEFAQTQNEKMQELIADLKEEVNKVAEAEGLDLVLLSEAVSYPGKTIDITDKVVAAVE